MHFSFSSFLPVLKTGIFYSRSQNLIPHQKNCSGNPGLAKITAFVTLLFIGSLLSACSGEPSAAPLSPTPTSLSQPVSVTDALGKTVTLKSPAQRVISLVPSNTELLFAAGAGAQIVGRDAFSDYPQEAITLPDIGGGFGALNTEVIITLNADLVLAADLTPPEQIQALEELGLVVFSLPNPADFDGLYDNLRTVAQLTGHVQETEILVAELQARVSAITEKVSAVETRPLVFYELDATDANAPYTAGPGTFIDFLIRLAGGDNLGSNLPGSWAQVSIEELIDRDPDLIILGDFTWGGITPESVAARSGWGELNAVKNRQVFTIDDNLISRPGPRLVNGLEALAAILHPQLFK